MKFKRIVVPADMTERNRSAVAVASRLVDREKGKIFLLHVIETIPGFGLDEERDFYRRLEKAASTHLGRLGKPLEDEGLDWAAYVFYGPRTRSIVDESKKLGADLIVIQSHRFDATHGKEGLGTLSYQIGMLSPCSVLLVKHGNESQS